MSYISAYKDRDKIIVWERDSDGSRTQHHYPAPYYFYYDDPNGPYKTIYNTNVSKVVASTDKELKDQKIKLTNEKVTMWESDIPTDVRFLSNKYYGIPAPKLNVTFLDIEVDYDKNIGFSTIADPYAPINAVSLFHYHTNRLVVFCVAPPDQEWSSESLTQAVNNTLALPSTYDIDIFVCKNEYMLLMCLLDEIQDSDLLCGWNSEFFDFPYIYQRVLITLGKAYISKLGFSGGRPITLQERDVPRFGENVKMLKMETYGAGRLYADYMDLYRKYEFGERSSYKLASIEQEVGLDLPKLEYNGSLSDLYVNDFAFFIRYNIRDVEILNGFEKKLGYVELANQMYHMSCAQFQHVTGTIKLAEYAIINYCHHEIKRVVPDNNFPEIDNQIDGALVLLPQAGMHKLIGSIDINSLYPSSIISINISPETLIGQFKEKTQASELIAKNINQNLTLVLDTGEEITKSAMDWRRFFIDNVMAVSGYGTVFSQKEVGIIPSILLGWFDSRKKYQKLSDEVEDADLSDYYDRLQYIFKIKLNSLYGALSNPFFRFYDLRMGESTTATGRAILYHQGRKVAEILDGKYDVQFPLYATMKECAEKGISLGLALDGPVFKGEFMSESIVTGDTDSIYFKTHADDIPSAIRIADEVAAQVNASFKDFMKNTFLCSDGFDDKIKSVREIVTGQGIFVEKKRYILHVVDMKGKRCDKLKIMGLDTKKTSLPRHVGDKINGFIELLLKGETWERVSEMVVDYKDELRLSKNIMDIGLPKGIKNVDMYTNLYMVGGDSTRLPGHVAAAIHYNLCLKEFNDKLSMPIQNGMKIKVFYLKNMQGKFKSIAIPTDIEVVPSWFIDNFEVDYDAHLLRLVDKPISNITKAIGHKAPSRQTLLVASLVEF